MRNSVENLSAPVFQVFQRIWTRLEKYLARDLELNFNLFLYYSV